jgi:hypothetical protein
METCPECRGVAEHPAVVCSPGKCRTTMMKCSFCKGEGRVTSGAAGRWRKGHARRGARVKAGLTQREQAHLLGISVINLNDIECGRVPR